MTEKHLRQISESAAERWQLIDTLIIHRVGDLSPGDPIVLVAAWSAHRAAAFDACRFLMEDLKSKAPFWKNGGLGGRAPLGGAAIHRGSPQICRRRGSHPIPRDLVQMYSGGEWRDTPIYSGDDLKAGQTVSCPPSLSKTGTIVPEHGWRGALNARRHLPPGSLFRTREMEAIGTAADPVMLKKCGISPRSGAEFRATSRRSAGCS